jgi:hypothetical protein
MEKLNNRDRLKHERERTLIAWFKHNKEKEPIIIDEQKKVDGCIQISRVSQHDGGENIKSTPKTK